MSNQINIDDAFESLRTADMLLEIDRKVAEQYRRFGYTPRSYTDAHFKIPCSCCEPFSDDPCPNCLHPRVIVNGSTYEYYYGQSLVCILNFTQDGYELKVHLEVTGS